MDDNGFLALLCIMLLIMDCIAIADLRHLLHDFLIGVSNRKRANKIHMEQLKKDQILLGYIRLYLNKYHRDFSFFHGLYIAELVSIVPQFIIAVFFIIIFENNSRFIIYGFLVLKAILCLIIRLQFDSSYRSKYRNNK